MQKKRLKKSYVALGNISISKSMCGYTHIPLKKIQKRFKAEIVANWNIFVCVNVAEYHVQNFVALIVLKKTYKFHTERWQVPTLQQLINYFCKNLFFLIELE